MNQFILISHIQVQNANAVAGFTWGFPAITHFLGFTHRLARRLENTDFRRITIDGCAVIAHEHQVHTYGKYNDSFTQNRNPPYLHSHDKASAPPVIEEAKMNLTVSLLIGCEGNIGNQAGDFVAWLTKTCQMQRLAGGSILAIESIQICKTNAPQNRYAIKRKLLPGFILMERSSSLADHHEKLKHHNPKAEMLDAWLDFAALKQQARPKSHLIEQHLKSLRDNGGDAANHLWNDWVTHLGDTPYVPTKISVALKQHFASIKADRDHQALLLQWREYLNPTEKTNADWERLPKPETSGYLVPIMTGYKAITPLYDNERIANTRDSETPVCFVEAVHSIGEWRGVNRIRTERDFEGSLWRYHAEKDWYLCQQDIELSSIKEDEALTLLTNTDDDFDE